MRLSKLVCMGYQKNDRERETKIILQARGLNVHGVRLCRLVVQPSRLFVMMGPTNNLMKLLWLWSVILLLLLLLSTRLQTPTDRAKCHKPEGTSREGNPKKEKINRNEAKKDKITI